MASTVLIAAGYLALITCFGWWGAFFAVAHIGILLLSTNKRR